MNPIELHALAQLPELIKAGRGKSGHQEPLRIFGQEIFINVTGQQTGGTWSMIQQVTPPGGGPPLHCHSREDEGFFVVEGVFLFQIGEEKIEAHAGDFLFAPRNIPHTLLNIGSTPAKGLVVMSPAGMEDFFLEVAAIAGSPDPAQIAPLFTKYGLELLGPPLKKP